MAGEWKCRKCGLPLEEKQVVLEYLGSNVSHDLPRCPGCGIVLITAPLAREKMAEVETMLEDK